MTMMRVGLVGQSLSSEQKQALASRLIAAFARVEVGLENPAVHVGFLVQFEHLVADDLYMGDAPMAAAGATGRAVVITTRVMAGPWTPEVKAQIFEEIEAVVRDELDMPRQDPGADFWMTILEVEGEIRAAQEVGVSLDEIAERLAVLPPERAPTTDEWERLAADWRPRLDERIATLEGIRDRLASCIGCGCQTLDSCAVFNPDDRAAAAGPGARFLASPTSTEGY